MTQDDEDPVDREAWRRRLERGAGEPPRATDERIRAEARRALVPHTGRWWLPASLAASLLLAVLVVQRQYEELGQPAALDESSVAPDAAEVTEATDDFAGHAVPPAGVASPAPVQEPPAVGAPAREQPSSVPPPAAKAAAAERAAGEPPIGNIEVSGRRAVTSDQARLESRTPVAGIAQPVESRLRQEEAGRAKSPEQWYAEIEALRAAGQDEEAKAELAKLEAAFPGWLDNNHPEPR